MKTCRIIVNRHKVAQNKKHGTDEPCISVRTYNTTEYAKRVRLSGDWELKQNFESPLCSGATIYIEGKRENLEIIE